MTQPPSRALQFQSSKFDHSSDLPEHYNAGNRFYGKDVAQFLCQGLTAAGVKTDFLDEDWGWLVEGAMSETAIFDIAIYNLSEHQEGGRPGADTWGLWIRAHERKKLLGLLPRKAEVAVPQPLVESVRKVFAAAGIQLQPWPDGPGGGG